MAKRFIVDIKDIKNISENCFEIFGDEVKHIQVLRYNAGNNIKINEYECIIKQMKRNSIVLEKVGNVEKNGEPKINTTLYIALLKNEKIDYAIQKAVELGVKNIVPFISQNVIVRLDEKVKEKRTEKFQKIANEACKQCNRTDLVKVENILSFKEMLDSLEQNDVNIFAYEKETKKIKDVLSNVKKEKTNKISCIIGPEGGFTEEEADMIKNKKNTLTVSLGQRILRADTASTALLTIISYEFDN